MRVAYGLLGPLQATVDDHAVDLGGSRQRAVLAVLLLNRNAVVSADRIVDLVWGEEPPPTASTALQGHVSKLRRLLGPGAIETHPPGYLLRAAPDDVDADRFVFLIARATGAPPGPAARRLREALALVRGPALADLADQPFAEIEAARLEELRLTATEARIAADLDLDGAAAVVPELEALVAEHPYRERLHALRMLALYRTGRQADALAAYQAARASLDEGLGIDPGPDLQALELAILNQDPSLAPPPQASATPGNLPVPPSPLVGRMADVADARERLLGTTRLLTLTGPGGIGKTRLALAIAASLAGDLAGGAWFVDLEDATNAAGAMATIGATLGLPEPAADDILEPLRERAAAGPMLLVLDNLEQVPSIAAPIAQLLASSPDLRVLATSRGPLLVRAEHEQPVPPLATSVDDGQVVSEAIALFLERARAVDPAFDAGPGVLVDIGRLCVLLDGLPLGIELAAARVRLLSPAAISSRIEDGLDVLRSDQEDRPDRQRSLDAAIAWSDGLLGEPERQAFRRCAVFAGGFTLQGFEAACIRAGDDALAILDGLLRHSLVQRRDGESGEPRFALLDTIRRFALSRLEAADAADARASLAGYLTVQAARLGAALGTSDEAECVLDLRDEHDNLTASLEWLRTGGDASGFQALAAASAPYWVRASRYRDGLGWIESALGAGDGAVAVRATLLRHAAALSSALGVGHAAIEYARASVAAWETADDPRGLADALRVMAMVAADLGDLDEARAAASRSLEIAEHTGDARQAREARHELAFVEAQGGDLGTSLRLLEANASAMRHGGDRPGLAATLGNIGQLRRELGDLDGAEAAARESMEIVRTLHDDGSLASILATLAEIVAAQGRLDEGEALALEGLGYASRAGARRELPPILDVLGVIRDLRGDHEGGVRLVAIAYAIRQGGAATGRGPEVDELLPGARDALGDAGLEAAWQAGLAIDPDEALGELLGGGPA